MTGEKPQFNLINIDFSKLSEAGTSLVNKVSSGLGLIYEPTHIRRRAKANRDAKKIEKLGDLELNTEIENRAMKRLVHEETKKQINIEEITHKALSHLEDDAEPDKIDDDWITHFFERAKLVSDKDMQILWGKILAGEANAKGSFSKRTVNSLSTLNKYDANLFSSICGFCIKEEKGEKQPYIMDFNAKIYMDSGIDFNALLHLEAIGLITFQSVAGYANFINKPTFTCHYFETPLNFKATSEAKEYRVGHVVFKRIGLELEKISGAIPNDQFLPYLKTEFLKQKIEVEYSVSLSS